MGVAVSAALRRIQRWSTHSPYFIVCFMSQLHYMHVEKNKPILLVNLAYAWYCYRRFTYMCSEGWTLLVHEWRKGHCFLLLSRQAYKRYMPGQDCWAYILNQTECNNAFIASEMQPYVHVLFSTMLSQISLYTEPYWMYTMHSLHQKYSRSYMCCSLRSYLRSAYLLDQTECIQCIHCIKKYSRTYSRTCAVLYEAISDQLKKHEASQSSVGPKVSAWYQTGVQCTHTCTFIAAKSVVYVFKT